MPRPWKATVGAVGVTVCVVAGMAGCSSDDGKKSGASASASSTSEDNGVADKDAKEISDAAQSALLGAKSVRLRMTGPSEPNSNDPTALDVRIDRDGNCKGSIKFQPGKGNVDLIKQGDKVWFKGDDAFWKAQAGPQGAAVAELMRGKYVTGATSQDELKDMAEFCDLSNLQKQIKSDDGDVKDLKKGARTDADGQKAIVLTGKDDDGHAQTMYVATVGTPYPLKIVSEDDGGNEIASFSEFDKPVPSSTPGTEETIDYSKFEQQIQRA